MADKITPRSEDFPQWYQDVVLQAKLADHSPVKGCMVIRPNGYSIWEAIRNDLDDRIKQEGVRNAYFPLFIPESFIQKEADHVEGFAPQVAVVTHAGAKDLDERLIVRPTSETIINSMFSKWIQSYRDLPLLMNQWANVVRWEMRTRLFLRTTEFLWQEGHTCHATHEEAEAFTQRMLSVYQKLAEETLAMPVIAGMKTEAEKFAGALRTYSIEAMMQDRRALQAGTSHNLSTHFAKAFETQFLSKEGKLQPVHQTSWGVSTRLIGGMIMTHSDDQGLVLPPRLADRQVVVIPIFTKNQESNDKVKKAAMKLTEEIEKTQLPSAWHQRVRVLLDLDESKKPGWKFHEYELIGIPIRIELGPKDLEKNQAMITRRDRSEKTPLPLNNVASFVESQLPKMQKDLFQKAKALRDESIHQASDYREFKEILDRKGGFIEVSWKPDTEIEKKIQKETQATARCLPVDDQFNVQSLDRPCFMTGEKNGTVKTIFAKAY